MSRLKYLAYEDNVSALGPGNRFVIWTMGCNRNCEGCIASFTKDNKNAKEIDAGALASKIIFSECEGITVSGGEPFLQIDALTEIVGKVKSRTDKGVIIYTGYLIEELHELSGADELLKMTDLLIDGPYDKSLDDGLSLRGSSNQRVIPLTDRYTNQLHLYGSENRKTQTFVHPDYINIVGIPSNNIK